MHLNKFTIVSIILLAILTFGAVNAAENVTVNDLTVAGDSGDLEISSHIDEINVDGGIQSNISNEKTLQSDNAVNNGEKLSVSNGDVLSEDYDYVITPQSFQESGLDSQIEPGNFKFEGVFDGDDFFPYFMFQDCVVDASEATFVNMGIILNGNVQISGLTLTASRYVDDQEFGMANGALVYVYADNNVLDGLNVQYAPDEGYDAYGIVFDQANNFQLLNSVIEFTGPNYGGYYEYAMKIDNCQGTNTVRGNKITANLPILAVDYSAGNPGLDTDRVLNTGIRQSSVDIINNRFYANVIGSDNNYPTLDCLMLESCDGVNIIDNVFEETDFITPEGEANYLNVVDLYYSNNVLVKDNKISVETNGGSENAGTSYPIQLTGPYENVVIDGNDLYAHCRGPALGIFSQNYYGDTEILVQNNNIDVTGLPTDHSWGLVSGIELQDTRARVYNNDIKTKSVLGYVEDGMNIYGISYAQYLNDNHNYEIVGNTIETEGQYAIYLLKAQDTIVNNNNLLSGAGEGDDAVYIQEEVGSTEIQDNDGRGNFYVSPNGDDGNSGSEDSPLQNIITAMDQVPAGGKIILLEGEHVIDHRIDIEKSVSIIGENPENTLLIMQNENAIVNPSVDIEKFVIKNIQFVQMPGQMGIYVDSRFGEAIIENCIFNVEDPKGVQIVVSGEGNLNFKNNIFNIEVDSNDLSLIGIGGQVTGEINNNILNSINAVENRGNALINVNNNYWGTNDFSQINNANLELENIVIADVTVNPSEIMAGESATVTVDFNKLLDSNGDVSNQNYAIPDAVTVSFAANGQFSDDSLTIENGVATTTYTDTTGANDEIVVSMPKQEITKPISVISLGGEVEFNVTDTWVGYSSDLVATLPVESGTATIKVNGRTVATPSFEKGRLTYTIKASDIESGVNTVEVSTNGASAQETFTAYDYDGVVTAETFFDYFDASNSNRLCDHVPKGAVLDFQGDFISTSSVSYIMEINKPINMISTTKDAYINLNTIAQGMQGENPGDRFTVSYNGSGTNISDISFYNSQLWFYNTHNLTINNLTSIVDGREIGSGVGVVAFRANSSHISIKNSYFSTKDNGGHSNFVLTNANHISVDNSTIKGEGNVGNLIYYNFYNMEGFDGMYLPQIMQLVKQGKLEINDHNSITNCKIYGPETALGICYLFQDQSSGNNVLENNTIVYSGVGVNMGSNGIVKGNNITGGCGISAGDGTQVINNNVSGKVTAGGSNVIVANRIITTENYAIELGSSKNNEIHDNYLVSASGKGDDAVNLGTGSGNVVSDNGPANVDISLSVEKTDFWLPSTNTVTITTDATGTIEIRVNGKTVATETVDNGQVVYTIQSSDIKAGENTVTAIYQGLEESATFNVYGLVTNETWDTYFDADNSGRLQDFVPVGATLDFQGKFLSSADKMFVMEINKPVNILSSTKDAYIDLNTTAGSLMGDNPGDRFTVSYGGSGSNISDLYFHNTQIWLFNTHNVTLDGISAVVEDQKVGSGVGATAIRANSTYVTVKNSYFYTKDNGGSTSVALSWADYCTVDNNTFVVEGNVGNMIYLNTYNVDIPSGISYNKHNIIKNNVIWGNTTASPIRWGIVINGAENIIDNNTIHYNNGVGLAAALNGDNIAGNVFSNNKLYGTCSIGGMTPIANAIFHDNYVSGNVNVGANCELYDNTVDGTFTIAAGSEAYGNTIGGAVTATNAAIHDNIVGGTITLDGADASASGTIRDLIVKSNVNVANADVTGTLTFIGSNSVVSDSTVNNVVFGDGTNRQKATSSKLMNSNITGTVSTTYRYSTGNSLIGNNISQTVTLQGANDIIYQNSIITTSEYAVDASSTRASANNISDNYLISNGKKGNAAVTFASGKNHIVENNGPDLVLGTVSDVLMGTDNVIPITILPTFRNTTFTVKVNDNVINETQAGGEVNQIVKASDLVLGTNTVEVTAYGITKTATFNAFEILIDVTKEITIGDDNSATVTIAGKTGTVSIKLNGNEIATPELSEGSVTQVISADDIVLGENTVEVTYNGFTNSTTFTAAEKAIEIELSVEKTNFWLPNTNTITVSINGAQGNVEIKVNGKTIATPELSEGSVTQTISAENMKAGDNTVEVSYMDSSKTDSFYVYGLVTKDTLFDYFDQSNNGVLFDFVPEGAILDFQGEIKATEIGNFNITISKPVNVISSTHDSYIDLNTTAGSLFGEFQGDCFTVNYGGSGSNITGIYIHNTQVWISNTHNVVFDNVSAVVENQRVGSGVGTVSVRDNSSYVTIKNGYFYTENNGGSSTLVLAWANHCTLDNNTVTGRGDIGNMVYSTTYNVYTAPSGYAISNDYNVIKNNKISNPDGGSGICRSITIYGSHNIIDNNTINKGSGFFTQWGTGENKRNNTYSNNRAYDIQFFDVFPNSTIYNNYIVITKTFSTGADSVAYNNTVVGTFTVGTGSLAYNNTATSITVSGEGAIGYNNVAETLTVQNGGIAHDDTISSKITVKANSKVYSEHTEDLIADGANATVYNSTVNTLTVSGVNAKAYNNTIGRVNTGLGARLSTPIKEGLLGVSLEELFGASNGDGVLTVKSGAIAYDNIVNGQTVIDGENIQVYDSTLNGDVSISQESTGVSLSENTIAGTLSVDGSGNEIVDNEITSTDEYAIVLGNSENNQISGNTLYSANKDGNDAIQSSSESNVVGENYPTHIIYVSETGLDTNDGATRDTAVASLAKAVELVPDNGKIIFLNGTYEITSILTIDKNIDVTGEDNVTIKFNIGSGNYLTFNSNVNLTNIKFYSVSTTSASCILNKGNLNINYCEFSKFSASQVISNAKGFNLFVNNSKFFKNTCSMNVITNRGSSSIDNTMFYDNGISGYGVILSFVELNVTNSLFRNNSLNSGVITLFSSCNSTIINCTIVGNDHKNAGYGIINIQSGANVTIKESTIINNNGKASAFYLSNSKLNIADSVILNSVNDIFKFDSADTSSVVAANDNWWGTNSKPETGAVDVDRWVIMSVTPESATTGDEVTITASFDKTNSAEGNVADYTGNLPDGFNVTFTSTSGGLDEVKAVKDKSASVTYVPVKADAKLTVTSTDAVVEIPVVIGSPKIVYVSETGLDTNDGETRDTAVASLAKAVELVADNGKIIFLNGTYEITSVLTIDKNIDVTGEDNVTIKFNMGSGTYLTFISNVNLTNIKFYSVSTTSAASCILNKGNLTINYCEFSKFSASQIILNAKGYKLFVNNSKFFKNTCSMCVITNRGSSSIDNTMFYDNGISGYGVIMSFVELNVTNSLFRNNSMNSGVISVSSSCNSTIINCTIVGNDHKNAGYGIINIQSGANVTIKESTIINNNGKGSAFYLSNSKLNIADSVILNSVNDIFKFDSADTSTVVIANDNWWGTNSKPETGAVDVDRWVIMSVTPESVISGSEVTITAVFDKTNSTAGTVADYTGNLPDGFNVTFTSTSGGLNEVKAVQDGHASATYTVAMNDEKLTVTSTDAVVEIPVEVGKFDTVYVSETGLDTNDGSSRDTPVKTIKQAIKIASNKIILLAGNHIVDSKLIVNDNLQIIGEDGAVVKFNVSGSPLTNKAELNLTNLIIENIYVVTPTPYSNELTYMITNAGSLSIDTCELSGFKGGHAIIENINNVKTNLTINNSKFHDNTVQYVGIKCTGNVNITNSEFYDNEVENMFGIITLAKDYSSRIENTSFHANNAPSVLYITGDGTSIVNCSFDDNTITNKGVIYCADVVDTTISTSIFTGNSKYYFNLKNSTVSISDSVILKDNSNIFKLDDNRNVITANDNWWGNNTAPAISGVTIDRWVIMSVAPESATVGDEVTLIASFDKTNSTAGVVADYAGGLPDAINVTFTSTSGGLNEVKAVKDHQASVTYTPARTDEKLTVTSTDAVVEIPVNVNVPDISIDVAKDNIWTTESNSVTVTIPEATGTVTIKVNGKEIAVATLSEGSATQTIDADDIVDGINTVEVTYDGFTNSTTFNAQGNVVTPDNFDKFFDDAGNLQDDVPFDELIFKGEFDDSLVEVIYIEDTLSIVGDGATLTNIGFVIEGDDSKLDNLKLVADTPLGSLISVNSAYNVVLSNLNITYDGGDEEAVAIEVEGDGVKILNNKIFFESHVLDDEVFAIGLKLTGCSDALVDGNNITTKLPCVYVNNYDEDYYMMGSDKVNPVRLKDCTNLVFTNNNINSTTNDYSAAFPTIQAIQIIGCHDSILDHNNISMIDEMTPAGMDNYLYGINFGHNTNVTFSYNNFNMSTSGGLDQHGTAYAFQGVESEVIIKGNNITSKSNGPNLGIYVASMFGGDSDLIIVDNFINVTGSASPSGNWALVSGIEIQNGDAKIYNNTIYTQNVIPFEKGAYIYGISYAQWMYGDRSFDIQNNTVYTEGAYTISVINSTSLHASGNTLYARELAGDDSINPGLCEDVVLSENIPYKKDVIIVSDEYIWMETDASVKVTVIAPGNVTVKLNGREIAIEQALVDNEYEFTISAGDLIIGENIVEVTYNGAELYLVNSNSTKINVIGNVVTNDTFHRYFDDSGNLKADVPFDELIFKGEFSDLASYITIDRTLTITGDDAVLNDIGFIIAGDGVTLDNMTLVANSNLGNLIDIAGVNAVISNMNISYVVSEAANAINVYAGANGAQILKNNIYFESTVDEYAVDEVTNAICVNSGVSVFDDEDPITGLVIDGNNITAVIPAFLADVYENEYYVMGISAVNGVRINGAEDFKFTDNNMNVTTNRLDRTTPTYQAIYVASSSGLIDANNITMIDTFTPAGKDVYIDAMVLIKDEDLTISNNNFNISTTGGKEEAGSAYAIVAIASDFSIIGNNITTVSNGPNLAVYFPANMGAPCDAVISGNFMNVTGLATSAHDTGLVSGIEIQTGDVEISGNTIYTYNIGEYAEGNYIYGISYAQDGSTPDVVITDNTIITEGHYAISFLEVDDATITDNYLVSADLCGDDAVEIKAGENNIVKDNIPQDPELTISADNTTVDEEAVITVSINPDADGVVKVVVNGKLYPVDIDDVGKGQITVQLPAGDYVAGVIFESDNRKFISSENETEFTVSKLDSNLDIIISEVVIDNNVTVNVNVPGASGNITIIVDGKKHEVPLENGEATYTIENITAGNHSIVAVYLGDDNHAPAVESAMVSVDKLTPTVSIDPIDVQYVGNAITITVTNDTAVNVTINGKDYTLSEGVITIENGLSAGEYIVVATAAENDKYYGKSSSTTFTVAKNKSAVNVTAVSEIKTGVETTIAVEVTDGATGIVIVKVGDKEYAIELSQTNNVTVAFDKAGEYSVVAKYEGDDKYNASESETARVVVSDKAAANIQVEIVSKDDLTVGDEVEIIVKADTNAELIVLVNGKEINTGSNGVLSASLNNILKSVEQSYKFTAGKAGIYNVTVLAKENDEYKSEVYSEVFLVGIKNATVEITPITDAKVGDNITIEVTADTDGALTIKVNGEAVIGVYEITKAGSYTITAESAATANYTAGFATYTFVVEEEPAEPENITIVIDGEEYTIPAVNGTTIDTNLTKELNEKIDNLTGELEEAQANATKLADELADAQANATKLADELADAQANATKLADELADANAKVDNLTDELANATDKIADLTGELADANAKVDNLTDALADLTGELADANAKVDNLTGELADAQANATKLAGELADAQANATKLADELADANAKVDNLTGELADANAKVDNLTGELADANAKVDNLTDALADLTGELANATDKIADLTGELADVNAKVDNLTGELADAYQTIEDLLKQLAEAKANATNSTLPETVVVDGVEYPIEYVNGTATVETNKTAPVVKLASEFSEITIGDDQSISIVLKDENGNVIADVPITYIVNGASNATVTDKDGKFTIKAENGGTITISYAGNDTVSGINTTLTFISPSVPSVVKVETRFNITGGVITLNGYAVDTKAGEEGMYYATELLDISGKPVSGAKIQFAVNDKVYNRTTNEKGSFTPYKLNMIRGGRYTMAFFFGGNDNFTTAFASVCVDLDKKPIKVKASAKTLKANTKSKYTITLSTIVGSSHDGKAHLRSGKIAKLTLNGKTYTGKTDKNGKVTFNIKNTKKGTFAATIFVKEDITYKEANKKVKLTFI